MRATIKAALAASVLLTACSRTAPPPPAPAPVVEAFPATLGEARALRATDPVRYERALHFLSTSSDARTAARSLALLGTLYLDQKRWTEAASVLAQAAGADAPIAPFLRLRVIEADEQLKDFAGAASVATSIIATAPESSAATRARVILPGLYALAGTAPSTDTAFAQAMSVKIDELSEEDFAGLASRLEKSGRRDLADKVRMRLLTEFPQGRFTERTYGQLAQTSPSPIDALSLADSISLAQKLANNDRYDQVFELLDRIQKRFPNAASNEGFQSMRLRSLFSSRRYAELVRDPAAEAAKEPSTILLRARAAWRAGQPQEFLAGLARIEQEFPSTPEAIEARTLRAKYYVTDEVDYPKAITDLESVIAARAPGPDGENLWNLGWTYTLAQRYDDALRTFDAYLKAFPDADYTSNSLFWSGKILDRLGRRDERDARWRELIAKYPFGYFSYRARELQGASPEAAAASAQAVDATASRFPDIEAQIASAADPRLETVRELQAVDLFRDASREMKLAAAAHPDNLGLQFMLADVYVAGGEPFKANGILQRRFREFVRHGGAGIPQRFWEILFPLNYWPAIQREAQQRGVDPWLIASIIRQESGFEPHVVSNAGAVGLMQIMPEEAARIATAAGIDGVTREKLFDPETNIAVGAAEYSQKLAAMRNEPILAIAAYNAGETAVGRWLALTPVDDIDLFVESIPYAETRLYVKSVTRNRYEYRRIYDHGSTASPELSP